jgi:hypothetical protein
MARESQQEMWIVWFGHRARLLTTSVVACAYFPTIPRSHQAIAAEYEKNKAEALSRWVESVHIAVLSW